MLAKNTTATAAHPSPFGPRTALDRNQRRVLMLVKRHTFCCCKFFFIQKKNGKSIQNRGSIFITQQYEPPTFFFTLLWRAKMGPTVLLQTQTKIIRLFYLIFHLFSFTLKQEISRKFILNRSLIWLIWSEKKLN